MRPRSLRAWLAFQEQMHALGATLVESSWLGATVPHRAICPVGHECTPRPSHVAQGRGFCRACFDQPERCWAEFKGRVEALGGTVLAGQWMGTGVPHLIRCAVGHESTPKPAALKAQGICRACARKSKREAELWAEFNARVEALGGVVLDTRWLGSATPHRIRCASGHESTSRPNTVRNGSGICRTCSGKVWDVFYVVASADGVKLGITSGDPRPRLANHRRDGYAHVVRVLDVNDARRLEVVTLTALGEAGHSPVAGHEYFDISVLGLVLDVVDGWVVAA